MHKGEKRARPRYKCEYLTVVWDRAQSALTNERILQSDEIAFETVLENIRILFFASHVDSETIRAANDAGVVAMARSAFFGRAAELFR